MKLVVNGVMGAQMTAVAEGKQLRSRIHAVLLVCWCPYMHVRVCGRTRMCACGDMGT